MFRLNGELDLVYGNLSGNHNLGNDHFAKLPMYAWLAHYRMTARNIFDGIAATQPWRDLELSLEPTDLRALERLDDIRVALPLCDEDFNMQTLVAGLAGFSAPHRMGNYSFVTQGPRLKLIRDEQLTVLDVDSAGLKSFTVEYVDFINQNKDQLPGPHERVHAVIHYVNSKYQ